MRKSLHVMALASPLLLPLGWGLIHVSAVATEDPVSKPAEKAGPADDAKPGATSAGWTTAVAPKPLTGNVNKGLAWLAEHQLPGGGWGEGEGPANIGGGEARRDPSDVADTCIAAVRSIRSGNTPRRGPTRMPSPKPSGSSARRSRSPTVSRSS